MKSVEAWARTQDATLIDLDTYAPGPMPVPFYEDGLGYQRRAIVFRRRMDACA